VYPDGLDPARIISLKQLPLDSSQRRCLSAHGFVAAACCARAIPFSVLWGWRLADLAVSSPPDAASCFRFCTVR